MSGREFIPTIFHFSFVIGRRDNQAQNRKGAEPQRKTRQLREQFINGEVNSDLVRFPNRGLPAAARQSQVTLNRKGILMFLCSFAPLRLCDSAWLSLHPMTNEKWKVMENGKWEWFESLRLIRHHYPI